MALALHNQAIGTSKPSWLRRIYEVIIVARQKQADARIAQHLRDLPDDIIRRLDLSGDAIEALRARDYTPFPEGLHGRVTTRGVLQGLREQLGRLAAP